MFANTMHKRTIFHRYHFILYDVVGNEGAEGRMLYRVRKTQTGGKVKGIPAIKRKGNCVDYSFQKVPTFDVIYKCGILPWVDKKGTHWLMIVFVQLSTSSTMPNRKAKSAS